MRVRRSFPSLVAYAILVLLGLFFIVPFIWVVLSSLNPASTFSVEMPAHPTAAAAIGARMGAPA